MAKTRFMAAVSQFKPVLRRAGLSQMRVSAPSNETPGHRKQRDHHEHCFSSGTDHTVASDRPSEHKSQSEWYALDGKTDEPVI